MKKSRNIFFKSFAILACLGAFTPTIAADDETAPVVVEALSLKHHIGVLKTSMNPAELGASVQAIRKHVMENPLTDLGEGAQDAFDAAIHVTFLSELDGGEIIPTNRLYTPRFFNFMALLASDTTPSAEAAAYYAWLAAVVYTTETLGTCSPNVDELAEGFVPYLRRQIAPEAPGWLIASARAMKLEDLAERVSSIRKTVSVAYRAAQIEKLTAELAERTKIPVLGGKAVFVRGEAVANGQCGWHSAFDNMTSNLGLRQILGLVDDGTIYEPSYYEIVMKRLRDTQGEQRLIGSIEAKLALVPENAESLARARKLIDALNKKYTADLEYHNVFSPVPEHLKTEPTEAEAKKLWKTEATAWLEAHQAEFDPWNTEKKKMADAYEQKRWDAQFSVLQKFKFPQEFLGRFITSDFNAIFEDGQLDMGRGQGNYLDILQRLNLVNINVWVPKDGAEPIHVKQNQLSKNYRVANVLLQGVVSGAGIVEGHYDPLVLDVGQLARVKRHEQLLAHLVELQTAQTALTVPAIVVDGGAKEEGDVPPT